MPQVIPIQVELARKGGGIAITNQKLAKKLNLERVNVDVKLPELPVFLVCHRDVKHNQKIRAMMDFLAHRLPSALT